MKKVSAIIVALLLVATTAISAFAAGINADEQRVLDAAKSTVKIDGAEIAWPDAFVNQLENYLNTVELTSDQADAIVAAYGEGKVILQNNSVTNISKASFAVKQDLLAVLQKAAAAVDATASYNKATGEVTVTAADGTVILKVVPTLVVKGEGSVDKDGKDTDGGVIKTTGTGANTMMIVIVSAAAALVVAGGVLFVLKKRA